MADDLDRRLDAWHHRVALVMLGGLFLAKQKAEGRRQWPLLSFNDRGIAMAQWVPRSQLTADDPFTFIRNRHRVRRKAKEDRRPRGTEV